MTWVYWYTTQHKTKLQNSTGWPIYTVIEEVMLKMRPGGCKEPSFWMGGKWDWIDDKEGWE